MRYYLLRLQKKAQRKPSKSDYKYSPPRQRPTVVEEARKTKLDDLPYIIVNKLEYTLLDDAQKSLINLQPFTVDEENKPIKRLEREVDFAEAMQLAFGVSYEKSWNYFNLVQGEVKSKRFKGLAKELNSYSVTTEFEHKPDETYLIYDLPRSKKALPLLLKTLSTFGIYDANTRKLTDISYITSKNQGKK